MNETDYSKYTVLVVDDIPTNILLVKGMLSKLKFNVVSANSGQQALDLLTRTRPDIILMDILMPGMNGFEATRAIRSNPDTADIPVIMLSALNSDTDIKTGLEAGANEFITKPFIQEHIVNCIITQINLSRASGRIRSKRPRPDWDGMPPSVCWQAWPAVARTTWHATWATWHSPCRCLSSTRASTPCGTTRPRASWAGRRSACRTWR